MPEGDLGFIRVCPYCGAGTHNDNKHGLTCLTRVVEFETDVPYRQLYESWRKGARTRLEGAYETKKVISAADALGEAFEMGAACADEVMKRSGKLENIFRTMLNHCQKFIFARRFTSCLCPSLLNNKLIES